MKMAGMLVTNLKSLTELELGKPYRINDPGVYWDGFLAFVTPVLALRNYIIVYNKDEGEFNETYVAKTNREEKIFEPLDKPTEL
jgi:hypothetical protein